MQPVHVIALLAAVVPLMVVEPFYDQVAMPRLVGTVGLTGVALMALAWRGGFAPSRRVLREPVVVALVALIAVQALATAFGVDPIGSLLGEFQRYQGLLVLIGYAALAVATAMAVARAGSVTPVLWGLTAGGTVAAVYAALDALGLDWLEWETRGADRLGGSSGSRMCSLSSSWSRDARRRGCSGVPAGGGETAWPGRWG